MQRLLLALLFLPAPALAEDAIIFADCKEGGCTCHISAISADEIALITGQPTPADAARQTLVLHDGQFIWSRTPRDDLDLAMGGNGVCEIAVFNDIIPQDGTWAGTVEVTGISGCQPQVADMVRPIVSGMAISQSVVWGGTYDPAKLSIGGSNALVQWTRVRADHFTGTVPVPPNGVLAVLIDTTATLLAPDRAAATVKIRIAPETAADAGTLAMLGMNGCEVNADYDFRRTGG
jgi:hypothetical protein